MVVQLALLVKPALFLFQQLVQLIHESHKPLGVLLNENLLAKPLPLLFMSLSSAGACIDRREGRIISRVQALLRRCLDQKVEFPTAGKPQIRSHL